MPPGVPSERVGTPDRPPEPTAGVTACETRPGRLVFLESGSTDGWIATDLVVRLSP